MKIAICIGDPNGIGPEIAVKAAGRFSDASPSRRWRSCAAAAWTRTGRRARISSLSQRKHDVYLASVVETLSLLWGITA